MAKQSQSDQVKYAIADMTSARNAQAGLVEAEIKAGTDRASLDVETLEIMIKAFKEERLAKEQLGHDLSKMHATQTHDTMQLALKHAHDHAMADHAAALQPTSPPAADGQPPTP
jgi:hypothetical protein